jgi:hypothetical protein
MGKDGPAKLRNAGQSNIALPSIEQRVRRLYAGQFEADLARQG